jgi:hypothetical protein
MTKDFKSYNVKIDHEMEGISDHYCRDYKSSRSELTWNGESKELILGNPPLIVIHGRRKNYCRLELKSSTNIIKNHYPFR